MPFMMRLPLMRGFLRVFNRVCFCASFRGETAALWSVVILGTARFIFYLARFFDFGFVSFRLHDGGAYELFHDDAFCEPHLSLFMVFF